MLFMDALKAMQEGKFVVRDSWEDKCKYLAFMPGMPAVWQVTTQPALNAGNYLFLVEDYLAEDWTAFDREMPKKDEPVAE